MSIPLSQIKTFAAEKALDSSSNLTNKMDGWINRYYHKLWMNFNWKEIIVIDESITATSGSADLILPKELAQLITISSRETNIIIQPTSPFVYQEKYLGVAASNSTPIAYTEAGRVGVAANLSVADTIRVVSSSASDTHAVRVTGKDANDVIQTENLTLNGTSNVDGTITFKADGIIDVVSAQRPTGTLTISETTSATVMDRIGPLDFKNEYLKIKFQGPADSARELFISYKQRFQPLINAEDVPKFDCTESLILYAYAQTLKTRGKFDQALVEEQSADSIITSLVSERDVLGQDYESTIPRVGTMSTDVPYFGGGRWW